MHTIQYIATQAQDVDQAHRNVKGYLDLKMGSGDEYNTWYDWFVTGGGRWTTDPANQYNDDYTGDVVHQSDPKFDSYLAKAKEYRQTSLDEYVEQAKRVELDKLINDVQLSGGDDFRAGMELYPIKKIYDMAMGEWDFNSYYYDMMNDSANMVHLKNSLDKGQDNWYLVPCDFHF
jgi:hypothetical protein